MFCPVRVLELVLVTTLLGTLEGPAEVYVNPKVSLTMPFVLVAVVTTLPQPSNELVEVMLTPLIQSIEVVPVRSNWYLPREGHCTLYV